MNISGWTEIIQSYYKFFMIWLCDTITHFMLFLYLLSNN